MKRTEAEKIIAKLQGIPIFCLGRAYEHNEDANYEEEFAEEFVFEMPLSYIYVYRRRGNAFDYETMKIASGSIELSGYGKTEEYIDDLLGAFENDI